MAELQITHSYTGPKGCYAVPLPGAAEEAELANSKITPPLITADQRLRARSNTRAWYCCGARPAGITGASANGQRSAFGGCAL